MVTRACPALTATVVGVKLKSLAVTVRPPLPVLLDPVPLSVDPQAATANAVASTEPPAASRRTGRRRGMAIAFSSSCGVRHHGIGVEVTSGVQDRPPPSRP